ncbi:brachyurin-like [Cloeon dipterum]|uniref:brachyurin-like n=1 Tax=Cloeon dipterum TaxID=197152 RepID=UPI00321F79D7
MKHLSLAIIFVAALHSANSVHLGSRIVGGEESTPGAYPWQVFVEGVANGQAISGCGGTIISDRHVLTAAQCFDGAQIARMYFGSFNITASDEPNRVLMETSDFTTHPDFNSVYDNDIAVITLPRTLELNEFIAVANLPSGADIESDFIGTEGLLAGWGSPDGTNSLSPTLRFTRNTVIEKVDCEAHYGVDWMGPGKLCIETQDLNGPCYGDAGSGLIRESDKTIIGTFSFLDTRGCLDGFAVGFIRVGQFVDWINGIVGA